LSRSDDELRRSCVVQVHVQVHGATRRTAVKGEGGVVLMGGKRQSGVTSSRKRTVPWGLTCDAVAKA
jgi:hypothetical protein